MPKLEPIFTVKDLLILRFTLVILRYKNEVSALDAILNVQTSAFKLYFDIVAFENNLWLNICLQLLLTLQDKRKCAHRFLKFNFESSNYLVGMYYLKPKLMLEHAITLVRLINTCTLYIQYV